MKLNGSKVYLVDVNLPNCWFYQVDLSCEVSKGNSLIKLNLKL